MSTVLCASHIGGPEARVLARFVTDEQGLHPERFDRTSGHWVPDSTAAGYLTGHDDWARRIDRDQATQILEAWGFDPTILDAPLAQPATT
jgi:hypothetical protein